jgi:hypothetical protein
MPVRCHGILKFVLLRVCYLGDYYTFHSHLVSSYNAPCTSLRLLKKITLVFISTHTCSVFSQYAAAVSYLKMEKIYQDQLKNPIYHTFSFKDKIPDTNLFSWLLSASSIVSRSCPLRDLWQCYYAGIYRLNSTELYYSHIHE